MGARRPGLVSVPHGVAAERAPVKGFKVRRAKRLQSACSCLSYALLSGCH